jgi:GNAT superfamily N-acetyltransferase
MRLAAVGADVVRPLRQEILRPGHTDEELVFPGDEHPDTLHAAVSIEDRVVAVATVMRAPHPNHPEDGDWRLRGMATSPELRSRGFGAALLAACETHARAHGATRLWCNARVNAKAFYERGGLTAEGGAFEIPGIGPHFLMSKSLGDRAGGCGCMTAPPQGRIQCGSLIPELCLHPIRALPEAPHA